jgi:hypothetical protein
MHINARIPDAFVVTAAVAFFLSVGNATSQQGVTLSVR